MNAVASSAAGVAIARRPASPYARRLARERGIPLSALSGSGPNGRIVAADVPLEAIAASATPPAAVEAAPAAAKPAPVIAARSFGAFSASIGLGPLQELIAGSGLDVSLDAFFAKAAARAAGDRGAALRLIAEDGSAAVIVGPAGLAPSEIARRAAAGENAAADRPLVLSSLRLSGVRPVAGSLPADCDLRLLVVAAKDAAMGEALLVHDADVVGEAEAARILADFRDSLENPLRLLV